MRARARCRIRQRQTQSTPSIDASPAHRCVTCNDLADYTTRCAQALATAAPRWHKGRVRPSDTRTGDRLLQQAPKMLLTAARRMHNLKGLSLVWTASDR